MSTKLKNYQKINLFEQGIMSRDLFENTTIVLF
jgi:hypothetical protein